MPENTLFKPISEIPTKCQREPYRGTGKTEQQSLLKMILAWDTISFGLDFSLGFGHVLILSAALIM